MSQQKTEYLNVHSVFKAEFMYSYKLKANCKNQKYIYIIDKTAYYHTNFKVWKVFDIEKNKRLNERDKFYKLHI